MNIIKFLKMVGHSARDTYFNVDGFAVGFAVGGLLVGLDAHYTHAMSAC
jgi:hypothetical protein